MMTTFTDIQSRIAQVLEDPAGTRFSVGLLQEAVRLALATLDQRLSRVLSTEVNLSQGGRDQPLAAPENCLYLISLTLMRGSQPGREMEPEVEFSYQFEGEQLLLHFSGRRVPKSGDLLRLTYAASHKLQGLDGAEITTLPAAYENALVNGAAGHACLLHATRLAETYGTRPNEVSRLMEISRLRLEDYTLTLSNLKMIQTFGFPPGFSLDDQDTF
jgi:hypothetical protein